MAFIAANKINVIVIFITNWWKNWKDIKAVIK